MPSKTQTGASSPWPSSSPAMRRTDQPHKQAAKAAMSKSTNKNNTCSEVIVGDVNVFVKVGVIVVVGRCQHREAWAR
jgi:hypothetical protein